MAVLYRPGEAGRAVGVKPSTLRVYVQRFSDLLSDDATAAERAGYRLFTERDVAVLKQARTLLGRGFTYERAAAELRQELGRTGPRPVRRELAPPRRAESALGEQLAALQEAVQAWKALAEERAGELARTREELRALRELAAAQHRAAPIVRRRRR
ncbi:MAG TPA: MerR family transcriptional regulator [Chloroflexota bacterium]|jgi:DNA-binding transcriptional MerR regulator|nr:MerR family transcriptional regulator [Chloroflexota bacterium]